MNRTVRSSGHKMYNKSYAASDYVPLLIMLMPGIIWD